MQVGNETERETESDAILKSDVQRSRARFTKYYIRGMEISN